ncbi:AlpA family phage regulatory protein [Pseudomonas sp. KU26590]|uniref:helix-turn-helix transcriptional regulator n=1 Tax=Pseudomonas sp. KU26590 TaxID=2991051 RepID=UPI00223E0C7A|nr:AlpA family phage regulatory protein [Pseudomonas sp. KU26590]UZJ58255.1 AlpA family phage regulatory protein [Pseudomonas sp. KU26590]
MNTAQKAEPIEYIRLPEVRRITGLSTATIYRMAVGGRFPRQAKVGEQAVAWIRSEVEQWAASKAEARKHVP